MTTTRKLKKPECDRWSGAWRTEMLKNTKAFIVDIAAGIGRDRDQCRQERDAAREVLRLIAEAGGTTTKEGLHCNGSWCGEQATSFLEASNTEAGGPKVKARTSSGPPVNSKAPSVRQRVIDFLRCHQQDADLRLYQFCAGDYIPEANPFAQRKRLELRAEMFTEAVRLLEERPNARVDRQPRRGGI